MGPRKERNLKKSSFVHRKRAKIAVGLVSFGLLRYLHFPNDAAKLISLATFGSIADRNDIEFVTPLLMTPSMVSLLKTFGSNRIAKAVYSLSIGYIIYESLQHPDALPRNLLVFGDSNWGAPPEILAGFRRDCADYGWITKEFSDSWCFRETAIGGIKKTAISIGKFQMLTMMMRMVRNGTFKLDPTRNVMEWVRTTMFCYVIFMMAGGIGIKQYNKSIQYLNESQKIEDYRPSKAVQMMMFSVFAFIGIHFQRKSKHNVLASCLFLQAMITKLKRHHIRIRDIYPIICYAATL